MISFVNLLVCLRLASVWSAPAGVRWVPVLLPPALQAPQYSLLQEMAALQKLYKTVNNNPVPPLNAYVPGVLTNILSGNFANNGDYQAHLNNNLDQTTKTPYPKQKPLVNETGTKTAPKGDVDTVVIDAAADENLRHDTILSSIITPPKEGRISIGSVISAIPFLPFEINVPDTIAWFYNGLINIISIIGSRPQAMPTLDSVMQDNIRRLLVKRILNIDESQSLNVVLPNNAIPMQAMIPSYQTILPLIVE